MRRYLAVGMAVAASASFAVEYPGVAPGKAHSSISRDGVVLSNAAIRCEWSVAGGHLRPVLAADVAGHGSLPFAGGEVFALVLQDGSTLAASELVVEGKPTSERIKGEPKASCLARHSAGLCVTVGLSSASGLHATWRAELRDGSNYVRQSVTLRSDKDLRLKELVLVRLPAPGAEVVGRVPGSPVFAANLFFAYEHPRSDSAVKDGIIRCGVVRNTVLPAGETLMQTSVIGVVPQGQRRRGFLYYIERERAHPYRPFPHYNSWYDLTWPGVLPDEAKCLGVISQFGQQLVEKRGARLESFVWDDGWDDTKTLWQYDKKRFPSGFGKMLSAAQRYHSALGFWMSPWGGYGDTRDERIRYAKPEGFETAPQGFSMAGPRYFARFDRAAEEMIAGAGSNFFKFDGMSVSDIREAEAMLRLAELLRRAKPDVFLSLTTGTWPSPYWLWLGDSTWRGGGDMGWEGKGSKREQWITYRDAETYRGVVKAGPLYPLNSLMTQGVAHAVHGYPVENGVDREELQREIRSFFTSGTCLQELYITPSKMTPENWDDLAEAMKWSRANADVLADTHWIGGEPGALQVYGWASWSPRRGIVALRNPSDKSVSITLDLSSVFELPVGASRRYVLTSPWKGESRAPLTLSAGTPHTFSLQPFEVLVLEARPAR